MAFPYEHAQVRVAVSVVVEAGPPNVVDGWLDVPDEARRSAEAAIGEYGDVLAVAYQCKRVLRSPQPCVAMEPSDDAERVAFREVIGLRQPDRKHGAARLMPPVAPGALAAAFGDRLDGLALLGDSLSEDNAVGRARELFRVCERAFRRGPSDCVEPLATFLRSSSVQDVLGFDRDEVAHWLEHLRAEAVHADRRPRYARSPDLEPFLGRIEYAGYDVLFNKATWRHPSAARREQQFFMSGLAADGTTTLFHPGATVLIDWVDPFGVYPVDHEASLNLPPEWIWRLPGQEQDPS